MQSLNVSTWFHPSITVVSKISFPGMDEGDQLIQEGDMLHIDYGITAMGLNTDTQHLGYVLRASGDQPETDAPMSLREGLMKANRMQDIVLSHMRAGRTGNEVLRRSLRQMEEEGIEGQIYCHPIGDWGHDAGAVMGKPASFNFTYLLGLKFTFHRIHEPSNARASTGRADHTPQHVLQYRVVCISLYPRAQRNISVRPGRGRRVVGRNPDMVICLWSTRALSHH